MTFFRRREPRSARCRRNTTTDERCKHMTTNKDRDCGRHRPAVLKPTELLEADEGLPLLSDGLPKPPPPTPTPVSIVRYRVPVVVAAIAVVAWFVVWWLGLIILALFVLIYLLFVVQHRRTGFKHEADHPETDSL